MRLRLYLNEVVKVGDFEVRVGGRMKKSRIKRILEAKKASNVFPHTYCIEFMLMFAFDINNPSQY